MPARFIILLVDDDPDIAEILKRASLQTFPEARFIFVNSFAESAKYLNNLDGIGPNLVLLDINLQIEPSGLEFLTVIRKHPVGCLVPVIVLSASANEEKVKESYLKGATAFTVKPFTYRGWQEYVKQLRSYWFETATIPRLFFNK